MIQIDKNLSMRRQCELLQVNRSSLYYEPCEVDKEELVLMRLMDELHLECPFYGSRMMTRALKGEGQAVNRKHVQRLMRIMGLESLAPKPDTSRANIEHPVYPYLLRNIEISRPNQVFASDITYIPLLYGFAYLVAVMDWFSRRVLSWRLSNTMESTFCIDALKEAFEQFGLPEIFNTDQGSQFTSDAFTGILQKGNVKISMDGKGRCIDNVFVERLWRSLKYENVYLHRYEWMPEARLGIGKYFGFYNDKRRHSSLGDQTPASFYDHHRKGVS